MTKVSVFRMVKFIALLALFSILLLSFVAAVEIDIGTKKLDDCIDLIQSCADCTYVNFSSYLMPNGTRVYIEADAIKTGTDFTYNDCNITGELGQWSISGHGDLEGTVTVFAYTYEVTSTGNPTPEGMPMFQMGVLIIIFGVSCFLLFLSSQFNEVGLKIFFMLVSLIFLSATMLTAYMISMDGNVVSATNSTTLGLFVILGTIIIIIFIYILIRQTINVLDAFNIKRGLAWQVGQGSSVGGYNTKKAY